MALSPALLAGRLWCSIGGSSKGVLSELRSLCHLLGLQPAVVVFGTSFPDVAKLNFIEVRKMPRMYFVCRPGLIIGPLVQTETCFRLG